MYAGKNMSLPEGKAIVLGRNRDVDLPLNDAKLSRRHCQIIATENGCLITDFASTNGTFVNGNRLEPEKQLELIEFDRIVLGDTEIELYLSEAGEKTLAVSSDDNMPIVKISDGENPVGKVSPTMTMLKAIEDDKTRSFDNGHGREIASDPDPLLAALYEMGLPLPPEPRAASQSAPVRKDPVYCSYCGAKIPDAEIENGSAHAIFNKMACKQCLVKPPPAPGHSAKPGVDAMLAGLDDAPTVVDTTKRPRLNVVEHDSEAARKGRQSAPAKAVPAHGAETPDVSLDPQKLFGDEFEEIV